MVVMAAAATTAPAPHRRPWALRLGMAGLGVEVRGRAAATRGEVARAFGAFARDGEVRAVVATRRRLLPGLAAPRGTGLAADGDGWVATFDLEAHRGVVAGTAASEGVTAILRLALPHLLADGLLVHAALLADGSRGFLCAGPSGAGKSTLARLFPDRACADELVVLRHDGSGFQVEAFPMGLARAGAVRLARVCFLHHAPAHQRTELPPSRAAGLLARQIHWPTEDADACRRTFATLTRLVSEVPCVALGFTPHPSVWGWIASTP